MDAREAELQRERCRFIVRSIEAQLASGQDVIRVADMGVVHRSYGWAIARSMRFAIDVGGTFDTPTCDENGNWHAHITVNLGRQPA
jgi:hypothetical protein